MKKDVDPLKFPQDCLAHTHYSELSRTKIDGADFQKLSSLFLKQPHIPFYCFLPKLTKWHI